MATIFTMVVPFTFASLSISATVGEKAKSNKYSLKNLNNISKKSFSLSTFKTNLQFKGSFLFNKKGTQTAPTSFSFMQFDNGNTTYIIPFKYSFKAPKFKTPSPTN